MTARPAPAAGGFEVVAKVSEIPPSGLLGVRTVTGTFICLVRVNGDVRAVADCCTHREFALSEGELHADGSVECAWHGAKFDTATGEATQGPAIKPVQRYAVRIEDDDIWLGDKLP